MRPLITLLLLTFTCFYSASSRVISQTLFAAFFTNETAQTVGRFTTAPGKGQYTLNIRSTPTKAVNDTTGAISIEFLVLRKEDWLQYTKKVCDNQTTAFHTHQVEVPLDSTEVLVGSQDLGNEHSSETFYFVLRDCFGDYKTKFLKGNRLSYDLVIKNTDGSHLSEEENGVNTVLLLALVPLAAFLIYQSSKIIDFYYHQKAIDFPVLMLTLGLLLEFCAVLFELLHLWAYSSRGKGYVALDWMNTAFAYLSRFTISLLLILMATGWTFKPLNQEKKETFIVTGVIFGAMIIAMALSGKGNDLKNFHDYQNIPGKIFLVINVILFAFFAYELRKNYRETDDVIVKGHYERLGIFGTIYLMSLPIIVVFADLFVSLHARHKMITYGAIVVQSLTLVGYAITLAAVSKNNEFYPVHYKNRTIISAGKLI